MSGKVTSLSGKPISGVDINVKVRHDMVRNIFKSSVIPHQNKKECFAMLAKLDTSDMLGRTQKFCEAVVPNPSSKRETFY